MPCCVPLEISQRRAVLSFEPDRSHCPSVAMDETHFCNCKIAWIDQGKRRELNSRTVCPSNQVKVSLIVDPVSLPPIVLICQYLTTLPKLPLSNPLPSGINAKLDTTFLCPCHFPTSWRVRESQILRKPSLFADATNLPFGLNLAHLYIGQSAIFSSFKTFDEPSRTFQIRTVSSPKAETMLRPLHEKSRSVTPVRLCLNILRSRSLAISHNCDWIELARKRDKKRWPYADMSVKVSDRELLAIRAKTHGANTRFVFLSVFYQTAMQSM